MDISSNFLKSPEHRECVFAMLKYFPNPIVDFGHAFQQQSYSDCEGDSESDSCVGLSLSCDPNRVGKRQKSEEQAPKGGG